MLTCCKQNVEETTGHFVLWFSFILELQSFKLLTCAVSERVEGWGSGLPALENHKPIGFLNNTSPDHMENHTASKLAFNIGPSSARQ